MLSLWIFVFLSLCCSLCSCQLTLTHYITASAIDAAQLAGTNTVVRNLLVSSLQSDLRVLFQSSALLLVAETFTVSSPMANFVAFRVDTVAPESTFYSIGALPQRYSFAVSNSALWMTQTASVYATVFSRTSSDVLVASRMSNTASDSSPISAVTLMPTQSVSPTTPTPIMITTTIRNVTLRPSPTTPQPSMAPIAVVIGERFRREYHTCDGGCISAAIVSIVAVLVLVATTMACMRNVFFRGTRLRKEALETHRNVPPTFKFPPESVGESYTPGTEDDFQSAPLSVRSQSNLKEPF